jgi:molecular chaperone DnaK
MRGLFGAEKRGLFGRKFQLAIAEGAAILAHRLGDETEAPVIANNVIADISYSTNHNYYIQLKQGREKIIDKQMPLPVSASRTFKTTSNSQKLVEVKIMADVENGLVEEQTSGFFTIEEDLPIGSDIIFNIDMDLDEVFSIKVHSKGNKSKEKQIVLGRGNKDSKALKFISSCFEKLTSMNFSEQQKAYFINQVQKEIAKLNTLGTVNSDSEKWEEIGTNVFSALDQAEKITEEFDEDSMVVVFANILIGEYPEIVNKSDIAKMQALLSEIEDNDVITKSQSTEKLRVFTDKYPVLITLFTIKMAANTATKTNPSDGNKLHQMHDQIVTYFRTGKSDEAFALMDDAIALRDKYGSGGIDLHSSIHLA